ncbi:HYR domain-containing protein [Flavobacteriales bacterium]|nr:HYR domain-containing protein [Flavobacteriales bacterium]
MKKLLLFIGLTALFVNVNAQTVSRNYVAPSSVSIDGVGNYGESLPSVNFNSGDFTQGCVVSDVDVLVQWAKTDGTCTSPGTGNSFHQETSFRINGPTNSEILALPGTWSGSNTVSSVTTIFSTGNPIPTGLPVDGTFGPNNGDLTNFNGISPFGNWNLDAGDNGGGDPLCFVYYEVTITTDQDNTPPVLTMPGNIVVSADLNNCGTTVTYTLPTATDNCSATVALTSGPPSGSFFPAGVNTVVYTASDPYGNSTPGSFTVTVNDEQNPTIICPGTIFAGCNPIVNYNIPTVSDNCPGATVTLTSDPATATGSTFPAGITTVSYEAEDASGNTNSCSFDILVDDVSTAPTSITASATAVCAGESVVLSVNGGSLGSGAQWFWYIGSCGGQIVGAGPSITVNPLSTANYYVAADGPCNQTACADILIDVTAAPSVGFANITSPSACGAADATITAVSNGGTQPYTYMWSNGGVGASISGLAAGPYEVTVTDASGCTDFSSVSLNDPGASVVSISSDDADNSICAGESVTFTATGAFQYQYYVDGLPVSTQNPFVTTTLQDGQTVYVTGTDFNFCTFTTQGIQFEVLENPIIDETVSNPSACATSTGTITTSVSGGLPAYSYDWSSGQTDPNISGIPAGPYVLTVTDANGCSSTETYALNDPGAQPVALASSEDPTNEICEGESVTFTASGSVDYEFFVDGNSVGSTNPYITTSLVDGESIVATGTDGNNCTATSNIIYPIVNPGPTILLIVDDADTTICVGESLSFFASGALTYEFFVDGVSQGAPSATTVFVSSSLTDGQVITVVGTDANQCDVESAGITVTVSASPTVSIVTTSDPTSCGASDGAITAEATGGTPGYVYDWSNGGTGPTLAFLNAGNYFVEVTDDAGCTATTSASLSDVGSSPVTLTSTATGNEICGGESVSFEGAGAATYIFFVNGEQVSTTNPFVTDTLVDGDIIAVLGLDTLLCSATSAPETFTVNPEIQIGIVSSLNPTACGAADGEANTVTIGGVPPFTYLWTDGQVAADAVGLVAGAYAVTVADVNGCESSDAVSLSDPGGVIVSLVATPSDLSICQGTTVEFLASGTDTYEFFVDGTSVGSTNPYTNSTIVDGQTIAVTGTDLNNCTATSSGLTYTVLPLPAVTFALPATACFNDDEVTLTGGSPAGGSYTVVYGGTPIVGDLFFPDLAGPGAINVDYTYDAGNGCSTTMSDDYIVLQSPEIDLGNDTTVCGITLDAGPGYATYDWSNGGTMQTTEPDVTAAYEVIVEDANGCFGSDEIVVTINPIPSPSITPNGPIEFCIGDSAVLVADAGYSGYLWSNGAITETTTVFTSDTVEVIVTNQFGCEATAEVVIIMNEPQPGAVVTADGPLEFCFGDDVQLDAGPGYASYLWSHGSTTQVVNITETGEYTVIVLDGNGCIDSSLVADPVFVTVWEPEPAVTESGDLLTLTNAVDFASYQWFLNGNPIPGANQETYEIDSSGTYTVCVIDFEGCEGCSFNFDMNCCVGIEEALFDGDVNVYPNPNNGEFTLEVEMQRSMDMSVGLYDMVGKQVWLDQGLGNQTSLRKQYDLSSIPDGVYFLRINADNQMMVQKLIKQQ